MRWPPTYILSLFSTRETSCSHASPLAPRMFPSHALEENRPIREVPAKNWKQEDWACLTVVEQAICGKLLVSGPPVLQTNAAGQWLDPCRRLGEAGEGEWTSGKPMCSTASTPDKLLGAPGIATRSKDATRGCFGHSIAMLPVRAVSSPVTQLKRRPVTQTNRVSTRTQRGKRTKSH